MSRSRSLFFLPSLAVAAACSAVVSAVGAGLGYARDFVVDAFSDVPKLVQAVPSQIVPSQIVPSVIPVAAKAFAHRLMKRRPTVQPSSWRMCSST